MNRFTLSCLLLLAFAQTALSQAIDYSPSFRSLNAEKSFRFSYENDFFSASDRDYTQGVYIELIGPSLKKFPLTRLGWKPRDADRIYGVAVETNGYTPNHIDRAPIQYLDRPYAATAMFRSFNISIDKSSRARITNTITLGVLGPWAAGKEIQEGIHNFIGYTKPLGWHNQVKNDLILNYQVNYEKKIVGDEKHLLINAAAMARLGTLSTKAGAGLSIMTGSFDSPFMIGKKQSRFRIHVYDQPMIYAVGYDATLQGGLLNRSSPYTLSGGELNRFVFNNRFGLVLHFRSIMLEYWQSFMTREYKTGIEPKTGGVQVGFRL